MYAQQSFAYICIAEGLIRKKNYKIKHNKIKAKSNHWRKLKTIINCLPYSRSNEEESSGSPICSKYA